MSSPFREPPGGRAIGRDRALVRRLRQHFFQQLSLFEREAQQVPFVTRLGVPHRHPEHLDGNVAIGEVGQGGSEALQGALPLRERPAKAFIDVLDQETGQYAADDIFAVDGLEQVPELRYAPGKMPGTETAHRDGQDPRGDLEAQPFVALEGVRCKGIPEGVERQFERPGGGRRLRGEQASGERATR